MNHQPGWGEPIEVPSDYPKVLRPGWDSLIIPGVFAVAGVGAVFILKPLLAMGPDIVTIASGAVGLVIAIGLPVAAVIGSIVWAILRGPLSSTLLTDDAISVRSPLGTRTFSRSEIAGFRIVTRSRGPSYLSIEPLEPGRRRMNFSLTWEAPLRAWLGGLPDLDARDLLQSRAELLEDPRLGETSAERTQGLARLHRLTTALGVGGAAVGLWAAFFPVPAVAAETASALAPVAALGLMLGWRGVFRALGSLNDAHPSLMGLFFAGAGIGLHMIYHPPLVNPLGALPVAGVAAVASLALIWMLDPTIQRSRGVVAVVALIGLWAHGLTAGVDMAFDLAPAKTFVAPVLSKRITHGKSDHYYVDLGPWGPFTQGQTLNDRTLYWQVEQGGPTCMASHPGALGLGWFETRPAAACTRRPAGG